MTIRAILRSGHIEPLEPLPPDWADGQELRIEQPETVANSDQLRKWATELDATTAEVPPEEHERFRQAIEDIERQSKDAVRREWGIS